MFMLYAIVLGLLLGWALGGRVAGLGGMRLSAAPVFLLTTLARSLLFWTPLASAAGASVVVPLVNVGVPTALLPNLRHRGARLAALGVACNPLAIAANGGWMPVDPDLARAAFGDEAVGRLARGEEVSNVRLASADTLLVALTDVLALPHWLPLTNVISIGDMLGGLGAVIWIAELMRAARPAGPLEADPNRTPTGQSARGVRDDAAPAPLGVAR